MIKFLLFAAIIFLCLPAYAKEVVYFEPHFDNFPESKKHVQKIVDYCWSISEEMRANPDLSIIDQGHFKTAECFEDQYIKLYRLIASEYAKTDEELISQFKNIRTAYSEIMTDTAYAGTDFRPFPAHNFETNVVNAEYSLLVQRILADLIYQIHFSHHHELSSKKHIHKAMKYLDNFTP
jgi:hypothetical protein